MAVSIHEMLDYLDTHPVRNYEGTPTTLLKMLHELYTVYNTRPSGDTLEKDAEELAFAQGIMVGMHLMTELRMLP